MSTIEVGGYDPYDFVPRGIVNLVDGTGLPSAANEPRKVCLIGIKDTAAPAEADQPVEVISEAPVDQSAAPTSAVELFGAGSELHLMCRAAFRAYPGVALYGVPLEAPSSGTAAEARLLVVGMASRVGEWTIWLHGTPVRVRVEQGMDPEQSCESIAEALLARADLPIEHPTSPVIVDGSAPGSKELVLKARHKGENGNLIDLYRKGGVAGQSLVAERFSGGDGVAALGQSGVGPSGALGNVATRRFHYIAVSNTDGEQGGNLQHLKEHLYRSAEPTSGLRQQGLYGWIQDLQSVVSDPGIGLPNGTSWLNSPRLQCVWSRGSSLPPGELAAAVAAHRAWMEGFYAAANTVGQVVVGVPRPRLPSDLADPKVLDDALHQGITPLDVRGTEMALIRSVTTRFKNAAGGEDFALLDTVKVTVSDFVADDLALKLRARFGRFKLAPDTDVPVPGRTATPTIVRRSIIEWLREYEKAGLLHRVDEHLDEVRVELSTDADGRLDFELPESVVDICAVTAGNLIRF